MLYGDLAQPRGGPMPGGHASHQSGLDADIWFHKFSPKRKMTDRQREHLYGRSVLRKNFLEIDERKWDETYTKQLMWFAGQPETERIFVNAAIKRRLCKQFPGDPRLARLRPWFFHDDHFHLRLKCPENEPGCMPQKPAEGIECEEKDLAYWFSKEVIAKFTTPGPSKPFESELPIECKDLVE
jgi:penicillin-insensitive murein endopeptidase